MMKPLDKIAQELRMKTAAVKLFQKYPGSWEALDKHIYENGFESAGYDSLSDYVLDALSVTERDDKPGICIEYYMGPEVSLWDPEVKEWTTEEQ